MIHVVYLRAKMTIYPTQEAQMALLLVEKVSILNEYIHFSDVFSKELVTVLSKRSSINEHAIELEPDKQSLYRPIYCLRLVKLETLKIYIKTNLANKFIQLPSFLQKHSFFLFRSLIKLSVYVWITTVLIIWPLKIGIC